METVVQNILYFRNEEDFRKVKIFVYSETSSFDFCKITPVNTEKLPFEVSFLTGLNIIEFKTYSTNTSLLIQELSELLDIEILYVYYEDSKFSFAGESIFYGTLGPHLTKDVFLGVSTTDDVTLLSILADSDLFVDIDKHEIFNRCNIDEDELMEGLSFGKIMASSSESELSRVWFNEK